MAQSKPWRMTLDTNPDYCNLNCIMCEDHSVYAESRSERKAKNTLRTNMDKALLEKAIRQGAALGVTEIIPSTMGEPLLYPHFETFLELCEELNLALNLTTNGTFPGGEKGRSVEFWAEKITPLGTDVKISWNGATKKTHEMIMVKSIFEDHIDNARRFIAVRDRIAQETDHYCNVTMQLTFIETNIEEIPAMVELAIELGFDRVKGHHLWAHFNEIKKESLRKDIESIKRWNAVVDRCMTIADQHNQSSVKKVKLENFFPLDTEFRDDIAPQGICPFLGKELWVDPNGRFNVCCAPDQQRKTLGEFGNLQDSDLGDLWASNEYEFLKENYMKNSLCKGCNMRKPA